MILILPFKLSISHIKHRIQIDNNNSVVLNSEKPTIVPQAVSAESPIDGFFVALKCTDMKGLK